MITIDQDGEYEFIEGTRTLKTSEHPAHQARVELGLPKGDWLFAATSGHGLNKFQRAKQTDERVQNFRKEVELYLNKYGPEVFELFSKREGVVMGLEISDEVLNGL